MQTITILEYNATIDPMTNSAFGIRSGTVNLQQPILLEPGKQRAYRVLRVVLSPEIANIYRYQGFDNTKLRITNDGGATWVNIQLQNGNYSTLKMLQDAINDVANQLNWYTSSSDPAIIINSNNATGLVYTKLDSTKLAIGVQIGIDYSLSTIYNVFGYPANACTFVNDAIHSATLPPQVDTQGTYGRIYVSFISNCRWFNGQIDSSICKIPFVADSGIEYIYPSTGTGVISPIIPCIFPSYVQSFNVSFKNQFGGDLVFLYGSASLELEIMEA
jgi:hypothetical protein